MRKTHFIFILLVEFIGCSKPPEKNSPPMRVAEVKSTQSGESTEKIVKSYKELTLITKQPVYVDLALATLCRGASQKDVEESTKTKGPHAHTAVKIYMNALAADAFTKSAKTYPIGSIIVKEKQGQYYFTDEGANQKTHDGVGGMIKRSPGYDSAHNDWEYFYFEDASKVESGKISSCVQCHGGAVDKDYVFGHWSKGGFDR